MCVCEASVSREAVWACEKVDKKLLYADFAAAFQKLEELGTKGLVNVA